MIFQLAWAASSLVFWVLGSQRGLFALAMGTLGLGGSTGIFGVLSSLVAYFIMPDPVPLYLHVFFVWVRPVIIVATTVFIFAATSHANNGLLRSIEKHERETQVLILAVCSILYALSGWLLTSVYSIPSTFLITWTTTALLLLILLAHVIAIVAGLGTLFDVSTSLLLVSWSMRLAVRDYLGPTAVVGDFLDYVMPFMTGLMSVVGLIAVPFVMLDEGAYEMDWSSLLMKWANLRWLSVVSGLLYVYELYGTIQANTYYDWGLWRVIQAIVFTFLLYGRFVSRIRERRQA